MRVIDGTADGMDLIRALSGELGFDVAAWDALRRPIWIFDFTRRRMAYANAAALRLWRADTLGQLLARDFSGASEAMERRTEALMERLARGEVVQERSTFYPGGIPVAVDCVTSAIRIDGGRLAILIEGAELQVTAAELRALEALRHTSAMVTLHDGAGEVLFCNPAAYAARPEGAGEAFAARFEDSGEALSLWHAAQAGPASAVLRVSTRHGPRWHLVDARPTLDPATGTAGVLVDERDVTAEVDARARIEHIATHDGLTDLPNRVHLRRCLDTALQAHAADGSLPALLCLDLDRFKAVNDTHGHLVGDGLLVEVAARLRACLGSDDMAARLGGDEFAVLHPGGRGERAAEHLAERIVSALSRPYSISGRCLDVSASVGVAEALSSGDSVDAIIGRADLALYAAKIAGRTTWRRFGPGMMMGAEPERKGRNARKQTARA